MQSLCAAYISFSFLIIALFSPLAWQDEPTYENVSCIRRAEPLRSIGMLHHYSVCVSSHACMPPACIVCVYAARGRILLFAFLQEEDRLETRRTLGTSESALPPGIPAPVSTAIAAGSEDAMCNGRRSVCRATPTK